MRKRRKAERKAGIVRSEFTNAAPFSTKLAREGYPHGRSAAHMIPAKRTTDELVAIEVAAMKSRYWDGIPLDPLTEEPPGFLGFALELEARLRQGEN